MAVKMGQLMEQWNPNAKSITFCVTEDCNLACKYCYMTGKNKFKKMSFEVAKDAVDYILTSRDFFCDEAVIWEFIGGEPFLEIGLIDKICDYIKKKMYELDHPWFNSYRFNFSTNGILYHTEEVQKFINKNFGHVTVGFSIDGNKVKHDLQRVKPNGSGSYDDVIKNVPLWQKQFPGYTTKATFSSGDLPYLKDSIISLWNLGIKMVMANIVFEDVWNDGDDIIFEHQLKELADYIITNKLWEDHSVRFFDPRLGFPNNNNDRLKNHCGSGKMLAIDCDGNFYPCIRFYDISLNSRKLPMIGNAYNGIKFDLLRPFYALTAETQSKKECIECPVATGCAWCVGCNYDYADSNTIYQRSTFNCKMHKANVRANNYFWSKLEEICGEIPERSIHYQNIYKDITEFSDKNKYLHIILNDEAQSFCNYDSKDNHDVMTKNIYEKAMHYAKNEGFIPILHGDVDFLIPMEYNRYLIFDNDGTAKTMTGIIETKSNNKNNSIIKNNGYINYKIVHVYKEDLNNLYSVIKNEYQDCTRINLILHDTCYWNDNQISQYGDQLNIIQSYLYDEIMASKSKELNVLTDIWSAKNHRNCGAGDNSYTVAPNGNLYICPAYYYDNPDNDIGNIFEGINHPNKHLTKIENSPVCNTCDVYHCLSCKFENEVATKNINIPSSTQCKISHLERYYSKILQEKLIKTGNTNYLMKNILPEPTYIDPIDNYYKNN